MKNLLVTFLILLFTTATLMAQRDVAISGTVTGNASAKIPFASILVSNSTLTKAVLGNDTGKYTIQIKPGRYLIKVSATGYKTYQDSLTLNDNLVLNVILQPDVKALAEVSIVAQRPLIEQKVDRITFNVENSVFDKGINALELLNQAPRVEVTPDGAINLIGKSSLSVMIDGRMIQGDQLRQILSSLRSDNIARIDIITAPPAKYSAEGNSGLIDIILKKNPYVGWLANFTSVYQQRTFSAGSQSANVSYKSNKLDVNISVDGFIEKKRFTTDMQYRSPVVQWENASLRDPFAKNVSVNTSLNYKLKKNMNIGLLTDLTLENDVYTGQTNSIFQTPNKASIDSSIYAPATEKIRYNTKSVSVYYDFTLDSTGKKLSVISNYFNKDYIDNKTVQSNIRSNNTRVEDFLNDANNNYKATSVNADLDLPYKFARVETGGALLFINNHAVINAISKNILAPVNDFAYRENTAALYISLTKKFNKKWSGKMGLRYENTFLNSNLVTLNETTSRALNNLFPSAYLSYNPNQNQTFTITYTRRIQKPSFYALNPYKDYIGSYSYSTGNPFLLPTFSNNIEFTHVYKSNLTATLSVSMLSDAMGSITTFSPNNALTISQLKNYYKQYTTGLYISYTLPLTWVNSYNSFNLTYSHAVTYKNITDLPNTTGVWGNYSMRNTFTLNSRKTTFAVLNFTYVPPGISGFNHLSSRANVETGVRFQSPGKKLQYNIILSDIFKQNISKYEVHYPNTIQYGKIYNDLRYLNVSVSYNFGNNKAKASTKSMDSSIKSRSL
jgi:outer membrane receptor protein involved in Fe transport